MSARCTDGTLNSSCDSYSHKAPRCVEERNDEFAQITFLSPGISELLTAKLQYSNLVVPIVTIMTHYSMTSRDYDVTAVNTSVAIFNLTKFRCAVAVPVLFIDFTAIYLVN